MADPIEEESSSLRDALMSAVEEVEADEAAAQEPAATPQPKPAPEGGSTEAPGASEPPATTKAPAEAKGKDKAGKEPAETAAPEKDAKAEPPANWSAADKATFGKLAPDAQKFLLDRHKSMEADYTKKTQAVASLKAEYEPVDQMFQPHLEGMRKAGFTPRTLIQAWASVEQRLMKGEGVEVLAGTAEAYKVPAVELATRILKGAKIADPDKVVADILASVKGGAAAPAAGATELPPALAAKLAKLEARLDAEDLGRTDAERRAYEAECERIDTECNNFKNATDQSGALLHPYFDEVTDDMVTLANVAKASKQQLPLEELYTRAIWANPTVRAKILEQQQAAGAAENARAQQEAERAAQEAARTKSSRAKRAGSSVTGAPGGPGQAAARQKTDRSLREELAAAAAEAEEAGAIQ